MSARTVELTYTRLDRGGNIIGPLDGVTGGQLEWSFASALHASGTMTVEDRGQSVDWLTERIRISTIVDGETWDLGVFLPSFDEQQWTEASRSWSVDLHSILLPLQQYRDGVSLSAPRGTFIASAATYWSSQAGVPTRIPDNGVQLWNPQTWQAGTDRLTVVNDLLSIIGYEALQVAPDGVATAERYVEPSSRPSEFTFVHGSNCLYVDDISDQRDIFSIVNRVVVVGQGSDESPGPTAMAQNDDPADPYSIPSIGVRAQTYTDVEVATQAAADSYAQARLAENSKATRKFVIKHLPVAVDGEMLRTSHAVQFQYPPAGVDAHCVIEQMALPLDETALQTTTLRVA